MFDRSKGYIGIDFGASTVKLAQIEKTGKRYRLVAAAVAHRSQKIDSNQWLRTAPTSATSELESALNVSRFSGRQAACTAPISVCDVRSLPIQGETENEFRESIGQQLSEIHSIPSSNIYFDFWQSQLSESGEFNVLSIADRWANQILDDHTNCRFVCNVIGGLPHALTIAASLVPEFNPNEPTILFDWGAATATICIAFADQPVYVRTLPNHGFAELEHRIGQALGMPEKQLRGVISEHGLPVSNSPGSEIQQILDEIMVPATVELVHEVLRTIAFIKPNQPGRSIKQGLIFGAGATLKNIGPWLGEKLGLEIQPWNCFKNDAAVANGWPVELLGPAIASSSLKWSAA